MLKLLHFQFRRLYSKVITYVFFSLVIIMTLLTLGRLYGIISGSNGLPPGYIFDMYLGSGYNGENNLLTPEASVILCFLNTNFFMLLLTAVFMAIFVTEDGAKGTIKIICSKGYSREEIFLSKYLAAISVPSLGYILIMLVGYTYVFIRGTGSVSFYPNYFCLYLFIFFRLIAVSTFYFMLSELTVSTGGAVVLNILTPYVIILVLGLLNLPFANGAGGGIFQRICIYFACITTDIPTLSLVPVYEDLAGAFISAAVIFFLCGIIALYLTVKKQIKN